MKVGEKLISETLPNQDLQKGSARRGQTFEIKNPYNTLNCFPKGLELPEKG